MENNLVTLLWVCAIIAAYAIGHYHGWNDSKAEKDNKWEQE